MAVAVAVLRAPAIAAAEVPGFVALPKSEDAPDVAPLTLGIARADRLHRFKASLYWLAFK